MMPTKLKTAATISAHPGDMQRVDTAVAIAFGASVAPDITVTPRTSKIITASVGYAITCSRNAANERSMSLLGVVVCFFVAKQCHFSAEMKNNSAGLRAF